MTGVIVNACHRYMVDSYCKMILLSSQVQIAMSASAILGIKVRVAGRMNQISVLKIL